MYGVEPYTTEHARYFLEQVAMPTAVTFDPQAKTAPMDIAYVRFLLHYFHRALLPMVKKVGLSALRLAILQNVLIQPRIQ